MTVPSSAAQPPVDSYVEDGATLVHPVSFTFVNATELSVVRVLPLGVATTVLVLGVDYTVAGGAGDVGSITKADGGYPGATITIERQTTIDQLVHREPGDDFPVADQEAALDKLTRICQELRRDILSERDVSDIVSRILIAGAGLSISRDVDTGKLTIDNLIDAEAIRDTVALQLFAGAGITLTNDDALDKLVISATELEALPDCLKLSGDAQTNTGAGGGGVPVTGEQIMDVVAAMLAAGSGISLAYNDAGDQLVVTNTSPAGYTDEQARDAIGAALRVGARIAVSVDDAGDTITLSSDALDPAYRGLAVIPAAGAFQFIDAHGGKAIEYIGGAAAATLKLDGGDYALSDGWGVVIRNKGTGPLTIALDAGVSLMVNGATASAASVSIAIGGVAHINRWAADDFTIVGPKVTAA
jgi:hypothetical protein